MTHFYLFLFLTSSIWIFNGCSGAASKKVAILGSTQSSLEEVKDLSNEELEEKILKETDEEKEPEEKEDPTEFNYFPYDLQLDTIAYMSCENNNYFTFKAGSYFSRSGMRLSEYFLKRISQSPSTLKTLIESSTKHRAVPRLSLAYKSQFNRTLKTSSFLLYLHRFIDDLISAGDTRIRDANDDFIEAKIVDGQRATNYALYLQRDQIRLVLSYIGKDNKTLHQTGGDWGVDIYGRVYDLNMDETLESRYTIRSISEEKRPDLPPQKNWTCPASLQLEIRRHPKNAFTSQDWYDAQNDVYKAEYPSLAAALRASNPAHVPPDDEIICENSNAGGVTLTVARAVLGDIWNINIGQKCISPASSSVLCYAKIPSRNDHTERVDTGQECQNTKQSYCPHFVSICIREN